MAIELRPGAVVAARAEGSGLLASIGRSDLRDDAMLPGLRLGNITLHTEVSAAIRKALEGVVRSGDRSKFVTVVVPDAAVRVLLLDFDALPGKAAEALAVVRFRLKKLLPFDAEHAVLSYQVMSGGRDGVRVLAVAMPCDVLAEYESVVTEAGYLAGSVLPSTLAALAGLESADDTASPALVVNAGPDAVTTAIVQGGVLLLHRTVDLRPGAEPEHAAASPALASSPDESDSPAVNPLLPIVSRESTAAEWSRQDPADYDRMDAETEMQAEVLRRALTSEADQAVKSLNETDPVSIGRELTQAVSVAAAYFEDTLGGSSPVVLAAGPMGAERLSATLRRYGMEDVQVREIVDANAIGVGASTSTIPRGWLAGVRGALRS